MIAKRNNGHIKVRLTRVMQRHVRMRNITINIVCMILVGYGIYRICDYFILYARYEITNDAYIDQYIVPINVRATGYITDVRFKEHQYVKEGDTIVVLDGREYAIRVADAMASLQNAYAEHATLQTEIKTKELSIEVQEANIREIEAQLNQKQKEFQRYSNLLQETSVSQHQYDEVKADFEATKARYNSLAKQKDVALSQIEEARHRLDGLIAQISLRENELDMTRLNLSYTVVTAPYDGYMGRRTIEKGQFVQNGQTLTNLVRGSSMWVTANYKETQIANIFIGQHVRIKVDAYPDLKLTGIVTAISEATGSKYSLVPTDNSAGNFVKIQQRIPVRIDLDSVPPAYVNNIRAGMMVVTEAEKVRK